MLIVGILIGLSVGLWVGQFANRLLNSTTNKSQPSDTPYTPYKIKEEELMPAFSPSEISAEERSDIKEKYIGRKPIKQRGI